MTIKTKDTRIHIGGLFRCCAASIDEQIGSRDEWEVGSRITSTCEKCQSTVVLEDGVWRIIPVRTGIRAAVTLFADR